MEFKDILYSLRTKHHLSQKKLADDLGVAQASVNYWEKGQRTPSIDAVQSIAEYFQITVNDLLVGIIQEIKVILKITTTFLYYLYSLGYDFWVSEDSYYQINIKNSYIYIDFSIEDMKLLENNSKTNIDNTIKLLVSIKTNKKTWSSTI